MFCERCQIAMNLTILGKSSCVSEKWRVEQECPVCKLRIFCLMEEGRKNESKQEESYYIG
jgi:hypothetical protein